MTKTPAPAAKAALAQATARWPKRSKASDGIVPSAAHTAANPSSDHEPGRAGYCHAWDLTHDPGDGCDCGDISRALAKAKDSRVTYIIYDRRIFSRRAGVWAWRDYGGSNPHTKHMHVSLVDTKAACENVSPWPGITAAPKPPTPPKPAPVYRVVTVSRLKLRAKPSLSAKVVTLLEKGDRLRVLNTGRLWAHVIGDKHDGYCWKAYTKVVK